MFMDLVLPLGLSGQSGVGGGTKPERGAATSLGFQTQSFGMARVESHLHRLTYFLIHY